MKLDLSHSNSRFFAPELVWVLEPLWILAALLLFTANPKRGVWIAAGLALLAISFLQRWVVTGRPSRPTAFDVPWLLLLVGAVVSLWASYNVLLSLPVLLTLTGCVALYYVAANAPKPSWLAQATLLAGVLVAVYFLIQYQYIFHVDKSNLASSLGGLISQMFPRLGPWQPFPNSVATLLEGLIPLGMALTLARRQRGWQVVSGVATGTIGLTVLVAASRGAWVALCVSAVLWLASRWRWGILVLTGAAIIALGVLGGYLTLVEGATLTGIPAIGPVLYQLFARPDRLEVYQGSLRLLRDFSLTGVGLGTTFAMVYSYYVLLIRHAFLTYPHSLYLSVWLGHGLLGAFGMSWLMAAVATLVVREYRKGRPSPLFQASWTGVITILIHGLFDARQYVDLWTMWPLFLLLGLVVSASSIRNKQITGKAQQETRSRGWKRAVLGLLALGCVLMYRPLVALVFANLGAVRQAKAELATDLSPETREAYLEDAMADYRHALKLDPHNRTANLRLGNLAVADGQYEEGIAHLAIVWQMAPEDPTARKALGLAYAWVGETDKAAELLRDTKDIVSELNTWAWWHGQEGRHQVSINAYRTSLALKPDQPYIRDWLSELENQ
ncbi:MAG: O-antigen ligase family protein [Anaerolineae bacterium]|nr:MAG: O-antigen ligase family protein [Anaerolineae bacterium]